MLGVWVMANVELIRVKDGATLAPPEACLTPTSDPSIGSAQDPNLSGAPSLVIALEHYNALNGCFGKQCLTARRCFNRVSKCVAGMNR